MAPIEELEDPLGFTRETASLLTGLGCTNLTQFKKRNVCLDDLKSLTDEDLLVLDVGEEFNRESFKRLIDNLNRKYVKAKPKIDDIVQMLKTNQSQLHLLNLYLKYAHAQLSLDKEDCFIDQNENLKVSQGISIACNSVLNEVEGLDNAIEHMRTVTKPKDITTNRRKLYITIGSTVGVLALIYYYKKK